MQTNVFNEIDDYSKVILDIRNCIRSLEGQEVDPNEELTSDTAFLYSEEIITFINKIGAPCECSRWKHLYQRESQETLKLHKRIEEMEKKLKDREEQ